MNALQKVNFARMEIAVGYRDLSASVDYQTSRSAARKSFKAIDRRFGATRFFDLPQAALENVHDSNRGETTQESVPRRPLVMTPDASKCAAEKVGVDPHSICRYRNL